MVLSDPYIVTSLTFALYEPIPDKGVCLIWPSSEVALVLVKDGHLEVLP